MKIELKTSDDSRFVLVASGPRTIALTDLASFLKTFAADDGDLYVSKVIRWADSGTSNSLEIKLWDDSSDIWRIKR